MSTPTDETVSFDDGPRLVVERIVEQKLKSDLDRKVEEAIATKAIQRRERRKEMLQSILTSEFWKRRKTWLGVAVAAFVVSPLSIASVRTWLLDNVRSGIHFAIGPSTHDHVHTQVSNFVVGTEGAIGNLMKKNPNPIAQLIDEGLRDRPTLVFHESETLRKPKRVQVIDQGCVETIDWLSLVMPQIPELRNEALLETRERPKPPSWPSDVPVPTEFTQLNHSSCVVEASVEATTVLEVPFFARLSRSDGKADDSVTIALHIRRTSGKRATQEAEEDEREVAAGHNSIFRDTLQGLRIEYAHNNFNANDAQVLFDGATDRGPFTKRDGFWMLELNNVISKANMPDTTFWDHAHALTISVDQNSYDALEPQKTETGAPAESDENKEATLKEVVSVQAFIFVNRPPNSVGAGSGS